MMVCILRIWKNLICQNFPKHVPIKKGKELNIILI